VAKSCPILVPLYAVGLFLLLPPQFYFSKFSDAGYRGTFWEILPRYFSEWPGDPLPVVPFPAICGFSSFFS
jgi:hypothetical protein